MLKNSAATKLLPWGCGGKGKYIQFLERFTQIQSCCPLNVDNKRCSFGGFGPNQFMLISRRTKLQKPITFIYKQFWGQIEHENDSRRLCLALLNFISELTSPSSTAETSPQDENRPARKHASLKNTTPVTFPQLCQFTKSF